MTISGISSVENSVNFVNIEYPNYNRSYRGYFLRNGGSNFIGVKGNLLINQPIHDPCNIWCHKHNCFVDIRVIYDWCDLATSREVFPVYRIE